MKSKTGNKSDRIRAQVETYLSSPQALRDVGALFREPQRDIWAADGLLSSDARGLWCSIAWYSAPSNWIPATCAYFRREEEDRYLVTDLGEAIRTLRLRTGVLRVADDAGSAVSLWAHCEAPAGVSTGMHGDAFYACGVLTCDLPGVIVAILSTSLQIACMEQ